MTDTETSNPRSLDGSEGQSAAAGTSHFARVGGTPAVEAAVGIFYDRVLADADLAGYFVDVEMAQLRRHMVLMLTVVLGGSDRYAGRGLGQVHQPLDITVEHYARVGEHLTATLSGLDVPADVLSHVRGVLAQVQDQVVGAGDRRGG